MYILKKYRGMVCKGYCKLGDRCRDLVYVLTKGMIYVTKGRGNAILV